MQQAASLEDEKRVGDAVLPSAVVERVAFVQAGPAQRIQSDSRGPHLLVGKRGGRELQGLTFDLTGEPLRGEPPVRRRQRRDRMLLAADRLQPDVCQRQCRRGDQQQIKDDRAHNAPAEGGTPRTFVRKHDSRYLEPFAGGGRKLFIVQSSQVGLPTVYAMRTPSG